MKRKITFAVVAAVLMMLALGACAKSEFGVTDSTEKRMTLTASNADTDDYVMSGSLVLAEGEQVVITPDLEKGSVKVELVAAAEDQNIEEVPDIEADAALTAEVSKNDAFSGTLPAGEYLIRATCTEKATGTVQIEAKPAE